MNAVNVQGLDGTYPRVALPGRPLAIDTDLNYFASVRGVGTEYRIYAASDANPAVPNGQAVIVTLDADGPYPAPLAWVLPSYEVALKVIMNIVLREIAEEAL